LTERSAGCGWPWPGQLGDVQRLEKLGAENDARVRRKAVGFMVVGLMVVNNLDLLGVGSGPAEADAPLVVDPDGMLSATIPLSAPDGCWRQIEECQFDGSIEQLR